MSELMLSQVPRRRLYLLIFVVVISAAYFYYLFKSDFVFYFINFFISLVIGVAICDGILFVIGKIFLNRYFLIMVLIPTVYITVFIVVNDSNVKNTIVVFLKFGIYMSIGVLGQFLFLEKREKENKK